MTAHDRYFVALVAVWLIGHITHNEAVNGLVICMVLFDVAWDLDQWRNSRRALRVRR